MSKRLLFGVLGEPYIYQNLGNFTRDEGILPGECLTVKN